MRRIRSTYRRPISDRERIEQDKEAELNIQRSALVEALVGSFLDNDPVETIAQAIERDQQRRFEKFTEWKNQNRARRAMGLTALPRPAGV